MPNRPMDRLIHLDPEIAEEFKQFTRAYRNRFLQCEE